MIANLKLSLLKDAMAALNDAEPSVRILDLNTAWTKGTTEQGNEKMWMTEKNKFPHS